MISVEENRVYDIAEIQNLQQEGTALLDTGIEACKEWEETLKDLEGLLSRTRVPSSQLGSSLGEVSTPLNKPEFETMRGWMESVLSHLLSAIPEQDAAGSQAVELMTENTRMIPEMTEDLGQCISLAATDISLEDYMGELDNTRAQWDGAAMEEKKEAFTTILLGMPGNVTCAGDPVNMSTGNFLYHYADLSIKGAEPLVFCRTYNALSRQKGVFGRGWFHNWEKQLQIKNEKLVLFHEDGRQEPFVHRQGSWLIGNSPDPARILPLEGEGYLLLEPGGRKEWYAKEGHLLWREEASGRKTSLDYEDSRLVRVRRESGEMLQLQYDAAGKPESVSDHTGRLVRFAYTGRKLVSVTDPMGNTSACRYGSNGYVKT